MIIKKKTLTGILTIILLLILLCNQEYLVPLLETESIISQDLADFYISETIKNKEKEVGRKNLGLRFVLRFCRFNIEKLNQISYGGANYLIESGIFTVGTLYVINVSLKKKIAERRKNE